jgi:hypothetical protein
MAILSNRGRLIKSLVNHGSPTNSDLLVIQDVFNNQTKNITLSQLAGNVAQQVQNFNVNFVDQNNRFTGSFYAVNNGFRGNLFTGSVAKFDSLNVLDGKLMVDPQIKSFQRRVLQI